MKNYIPFVFILLYVMISCQQEIDMPLYNNSVSEISTIDYSRSIEEDSLLITELGYQVRKIEEFDNYYIVNDVRLFNNSSVNL